MSLNRCYLHCTGGEARAIAGCVKDFAALAGTRKMATTIIDAPKIEEGAIGTTSYEYLFTMPCEKVNIHKLATHMLPPLYALVFGVGLLGNVMVVVILTKYKRLCSMANIYLLNLAISDLLFLFTLPFWIHSLLWDEWAFGNFMCKLLSGLYCIGLFGEVFFIILLTMDRYLAIVHAVFALRARTVTFGIVSSVCTWVLAGLAALPEFIFLKTQEGNEKLYCSIIYPEDEEDGWKRFHAVRVNVFSLALPLLVMAFCYSGIIKTLVRCPNQVKYKTIRLIFVIMVVFFIFWTPFNLVLLLSTFQTIFFETSCERSKQLDVALLVTEVVSFTHCCVNPVIYAFVGERFQEHLRHFFRRHVALPLGQCTLLLSNDNLERVSSGSRSTGEQELSAVF
ncbi:C-C chemokine receptor type 3-like isoform X1 [Saccopteryx bilineata]|uniref:C-C chemokine receptor type 3-like isoform X1 n=2 Tax=Saccopteryx bilineata TaxID=59482 RepID=UPI00338E2091